MSTPTYHDIKPSDTMQSICCQYGISAKELRKANNFRGMTLKSAPSKLVIPTLGSIAVEASSPRRQPLGMAPKPRSNYTNRLNNGNERRPSSLSQRLSAYDNAASFREEKQHTTVEEKIIEGGLAVKVLSLARNGKQESITTFNIEDRMSRFQKAYNHRVMEQQVYIENETQMEQFQVEEDEDAKNSSEEESETELERRRSSYRATANRSKDLRKQKMQDAKKYRKTRRLDGGSSVLQECMEAEQERMSALQKRTSGLNDSTSTALSTDDELSSEEEEDGNKNHNEHMSSHLPGLQWKPKANAPPPTRKNPFAKKKAHGSDFVIKKDFSIKKPVDEDLTMELQRIMRDRSLTKYEREIRCEELKRKSKKSKSSVDSSSSSSSTTKKKLGREALLAQFNANSKAWMKTAKKQTNQHQPFVPRQ